MLAAVLRGRPLILDRGGVVRRHRQHLRRRRVAGGRHYAKEHLGNLRRHLTQVDERAARAQTALQHHACPRAHVQVHVDALPPLDLLAVVARPRDEVVRRTAEARRLEIVETRHRVAAAAGQPRINRHRDAELIEVRGTDRAVVGDREVLIRAPEIGGIERRAREQLALHARRELPVREALVPAAQEIGIVNGAGARAAERRVRHRAAFAIGQRADQIAVGDEVAVGVGP